MEILHFKIDCLVLLLDQLLVSLNYEGVVTYYVIA